MPLYVALRAHSYMSAFVFSLLLMIFLKPFALDLTTVLFATVSNFNLLTITATYTIYLFTTHYMNIKKQKNKERASFH